MVSLVDTMRSFLSIFCWPSLIQPLMVISSRSVEAEHFYLFISNFLRIHRISLLQFIGFFAQILNNTSVCLYFRFQNLWHNTRCTFVRHSLNNMMVEFSLDWVTRVVASSAISKYFTLSQRICRTNLINFQLFDTFIVFLLLFGTEFACDTCIRWMAFANSRHTEYSSFLVCARVVFLWISRQLLAAQCKLRINFIKFF